MPCLYKSYTEHGAAARNAWMDDKSGPANLTKIEPNDDYVQLVLISSISELM